MEVGKISTVVGQDLQDGSENGPVRGHSEDRFLLDRDLQVLGGREEGRGVRGETRTANLAAMLEGTIEVQTGQRLPEVQDKVDECMSAICHTT